MSYAYTFFTHDTDIVDSNTPTAMHMKVIYVQIGLPEHDSGVLNMWLHFQLTSGSHSITH